MAELITQQSARYSALILQLKAVTRRLVPVDDPDADIRRQYAYDRNSPSLLEQRREEVVSPAAWRRWWAEKRLGMIGAAAVPPLLDALISGDWDEDSQHRVERLLLRRAAHDADSMRAAITGTLGRAHTISGRDRLTRILAKIERSS